MHSLDASGLWIGTVGVVAAAWVLVEFSGLGWGGLRWGGLGWMQWAARWLGFVFGRPLRCSCPL
jgi:hypothetical protein